MKLSLIYFYAFIIMILEVGCAPLPPKNTLNACQIFSQYPKWYQAAKETNQKWQIPIAVQLAVINQESHFDAHAKPPRRKILGFIPWTRPSSAYGYAQALETTWKHYSFKNGKKGNRSCFADCTDFVGWYTAMAHNQLGIPVNNVADLYLAYHEGINGYAHQTYLQKPWLLSVANKVNVNAQRYQNQLSRCEADLGARSWWQFW